MKIHWWGLHRANLPKRKHTVITAVEWRQRISHYGCRNETTEHTHTHTHSVLQLLCKTHPEWLFTSQVTGPQSSSPSLWFWSCDVSPIICISNKFQVVLICWFKVHTLRLLVVEKEKRKKPFPSPGDLPDPGIKPRSPALQVDFLPSELQRLQGRCYLIFQSLIF